MQNKRIVIFATICLLAVATIGILLFLNAKKSENPANDQNKNGDGVTNSEQISTQINTDSNGTSTVKYPLPSFSPNINYISNSADANLTVEQKRNLLTFGGNIVNLALSYEGNEFRNGVALVRYASAKGRASLEQLQVQYKTAARPDQYAVVDSTRPIGLFASTDRPGAYILSFEVSLYEPNTMKPDLKPFGRAQAEIQIYRTNTGYEFDYIYTNPL